MKRVSHIARCIKKIYRKKKKKVCTKRIRTGFYLLHPEKLAKWPQDPFHFLGGGPNPSSLKLLDCGVIPVSDRPIASVLYFIFYD